MEGDEFQPLRKYAMVVKWNLLFLNLIVLVRFRFILYKPSKHLVLIEYSFHIVGGGDRN